MARELTNLEQLLRRISNAGEDDEKVRLDIIIEAVGSRSFAPLLLLIGVILTSPLSGIPGMPTTMALVLIMIALQLLFGRKHFWIPRWLLRRSVSKKNLQKAFKWLHPPARFIDRLIKPRMTFFVNRIGTFVVAILCIIIAAGLPLMELVPFTATSAGVALTIFGLALVAHDGLLALLAFIFSAGVLIFVISKMI